MPKESFEAKEKIADFLYRDALKAYTTFDITNIFKQQRKSWMIAEYRRANYFMTYLSDTKILKRVKLKHQATASQKIIWVEPTADNYNLALTIKKVDI